VLTGRKKASNLFHAMRNNLSNITEINGKKLKKSQLNLLKKLEKLGVMPASEIADRVNPYSGARCTLPPLAVTLYDFVINSYNAGMVGRFVPLETWNNCRYFFLEFWPDEYFALID